MRAVVQRVVSARVTVSGRCVAAIKSGLLVFVGVARDDDESDLTYLANKIVGLRLFGGAKGRFGRSVGEVEGAILLVSQFTLYGDCRRGRRPSFDEAAQAIKAELMYEALIRALCDLEVEVQTGQFRADMIIESVNDGPVTILLDSNRVF